MINLLKEFQEVFAYSVEEMHGIDPDVAIHRLNVDPSIKPICLKKRHLEPAIN